MTKQKIEIEISKSTIWRVIIVFVSFGMIIKLQSLIFYLLFALLFAVAIAPLVGWFQARGLKHNSEVALALVMLVGGIFALAGVVAVSLINTVTDFVGDLPIYIESLRQYGATRDYVNGISSGSSLLAGVSKMFEAVLFTFFFTIYMLLERDYLLRLVHSVTPKSWRSRLKDLEHEFVDVVGNYIRGQLLTSFLMGVATYAIFRVLGIPNALALAIIAGLTDIIPVVGGLIGLIPAVLVAVTVSPTVAVLCIVLVQTYATLSNYFIMPKIYGEALNMSPFIVTVATMVGLLLFGIPGIILALPGAAMIGYIMTEYYSVPVIEEDYNNAD